MPDGLSVWQPQMISLKFSMCPGLEIYKLLNTQCDSATKIFYPCFVENISSERFQSRNSVILVTVLPLIIFQSG